MFLILLRRTLYPIVNSPTVEKIQIIVVNDGYTDSTDEIVRDYYCKCATISRQNGRYGTTINTTLQISKGKYFSLLDGDDCFETENLEEYIDFL